MQNKLCAELTDTIIGCYYTVYNHLGYGFLERVYEKALSSELVERGLTVKAQQPITVMYKNLTVGEYFCDLLVDNKVIVELKASKTLLAEHEAQLLNYLKATDIEVGLLLNYGPKPEVRRKVFTNHLKSYNGAQLNTEKEIQLDADNV